MSDENKTGVETLLLQHEIEQFYYAEASMLDDCDFDSWAGLLHRQIRYFMPIRSNRIQREKSLEYTRDDESAHFDEDYESLQGRLRKVKSDVGWSENPASRTRHIIGNVVISSGSTSDGLKVTSSFLVYRNRLERQVDIFAGYRDDELLRSSDDGKLKIRNRTIYIDQSTVLANNLSFFF